MLLALDDGRALAASQLAAEAGITPATASSHLGKMVAAGLLTVEARGRNRFYRLTGPQVGRVLELLSELAPSVPVRSLRQGVRAQMLREARTCYDHLAGRLGVAVMTSMIEADQLSADPLSLRPDHEHGHRGHRGTKDVEYWLTPTGERFLTAFGIALPPQRLVKHCLDWSERRHHVSGVVGRDLLARCFALAWIRRSPGSRAVMVTEAGRLGMLETFRISLPAESDRRP
jgi:DNA-binding MarR family transcriptional regulator